MLLVLGKLQIEQNWTTNEDFTCSVHSDCKVQMNEIFLEHVSDFSTHVTEFVFSTSHDIEEKNILILH